MIQKSNILYKLTKILPCLDETIRNLKQCSLTQDCSSGFRKYNTQWHILFDIETYLSDLGLLSRATTYCVGATANTAAADVLLSLKRLHKMC